MIIAPSNLIFPAILSLAAWRIYSRTRRHIGRQPLQPKRTVVRIVIFGVLGLLVALAGLLIPKLLIGYGGGLALGSLLAWVGLRLTRFENAPDGLYYTPNTYIGIALSVLFVARLGYRLLALHAVTDAPAPHQPPAFQSSLTFFVFGLLAGYYILYYAGVLWHCRELKLNANK